MAAVEPGDGLWRYVATCFSSDYSSVSCASYWSWVADGAFALAGLIFVLVGWSLFRQHSAYWRGLLHLRGRSGAKAGDAISSDFVEMEERFRAALEKRKAELRDSGAIPPEK